MSEPSTNYLSVVANANKATQAWKTAALVLGAVVIFFAVAFIYQSRNRPVVLVPYDLAANGKTMSVAINGEIRGTSAEYMANVGLADLTLVLNFTPDNVITQTSRFLNRLTDDLYGRQRETLLAQAEEMRRRAVTQSFHPSNIAVNTNGDRVEIEGTQLRFTGGKETVRSKVTYVISYKVVKGYLHVSDLRQK